MATKVLLMWGYNNNGPYRPGWAEVLWYLPAVTNAKDAQLNTDVQQIMNARTAIMGNNVTATGYRISIPGQPKKSRTVYALASAGAPSPLAQYPSVSWGPAEIPNAALMIELQTAQAQRRKMYLAGLPDTLFSTGALVGPNFAAPGATYQAAFLAWQSILLNQKWGSYFLNLLPAGQPAPISYWQQGPAPDNNLQFVLPNTAAYQPNVGEIVHVRHVLMGVSGVLRPIGRWRIFAKGAVDAANTFYELDNSSAYTAVLVTEPGDVSSTTKGYWPFAEALNFLQTSRRRGVGPVRPRGRSRRTLRRQPS